jgi:hypothetical protein
LGGIGGRAGGFGESAGGGLGEAFLGGLSGFGIFFFAAAVGGIEDVGLLGGGGLGEQDEQDEDERAAERGVHG